MFDSIADDLADVDLAMQADLDRAWLTELRTREQNGETWNRPGRAA